jgi:hypothetical protein
MGLTHILNTSIPKMVTAIVRQSTVYVLELGSEVGLLTWTEQLVCEQSGDYYWYDMNMELVLLAKGEWGYRG